jgi:hypothetical protein
MPKLREMLCRYNDSKNELDNIKHRLATIESKIQDESTGDMDSRVNIPEMIKGAESRLTNKITEIVNTGADSVSGLSNRLDKLEGNGLVGGQPGVGGGINIQDTIEAAIEKEKKKSFAVISNLPEYYPDGSRVSEIAVARQIANVTGSDPAMIISAFRNGPRVNGRPRFVKVQFVNPNAQRNFLKQSGYIKSRGDSFLKRVFIRRDFTFAERETLRNLKKEKAERERRGEKVYLDHESLSLKEWAPRSEQLSARNHGGSGYGRIREAPETAADENELCDPSQSPIRLPIQNGVHLLSPNATPYQPATATVDNTPYVPSRVP